MSVTHPPLTVEGIRKWHSNPVMHGAQTVFSPDPQRCAICYLLDVVAALQQKGI